MILESLVPKIDFKLSQAFFIGHFKPLILPSCMVFHIMLKTSC